MSKEIDKHDAVDESFSNVADVHKYLKAHGWKISKTQLYQHVDEKKIKRGDNGKFEISSIDKYALKYLRRLDGSKPSKDLAKIQERRYSAELRAAEAGADMKETKVRLLKGEYVEKGEFERALAQRAAIFKNDLESFCRSQAPAIISLVGGALDKTPDLIEFMLDKTAEWLNRYADERDFTVPAPTPAALLAKEEQKTEKEDDDEE
jgi:hypothetical protein